eukprot:GHVH01003817.1.p1 GENE.GHVH01003817.1~~GHVH01003817.1.p1  ORF type:complete len:125 (+),score=15.60 GHVH01003817.1:680-1054(+)
MDMPKSDDPPPGLGNIHNPALALKATISDYPNLVEKYFSHIAEKSKCYKGQTKILVNASPLLNSSASGVNVDDKSPKETTSKDTGQVTTKTPKETASKDTGQVKTKTPKKVSTKSKAPKKKAAV